VNPVSPDHTVEVIVRVRVISEHQPVQRRRTPVAANPTERELAVLPLASHVSVFGARREFSVFAAGEFRIHVQARIDQGPHEADDRTSRHYDANRAAGADGLVSVTQHQLAPS